MSGKNGDPSDERARFTRGTYSVLQVTLEVPRALRGKKETATGDVVAVFDTETL